MARCPTPTEALRTITERCRLPAAVRLGVETARGAFLAEPIDVPSSPALPPTPVAAINGYALPSGFAGGRCRFRSRLLDDGVDGDHGDHGDHRDDPSPGKRPDGDDDLPCLERVESGDLLPPGTDRVLPVSAAVITETAEVSIDASALPPPGHGVEEPARFNAPVRLAARRRIGPRLQAFLLARGVHEVSVTPASQIRIATLGDRLVDPVAIDSVLAGAPPDAAERPVADVTGFWLPAAVRALGHDAQSLGAQPADPAGILAVLRRIAATGPGLAILTGGLGAGISDRTVEALQTGPFHIFFSSLSVEPGARFLFAQGMGLDLVVLGGAPLDAAVGFDLLVAPLLLRLRGAPPRVWDWTRSATPSPDRRESHREDPVTPWAVSPIAADDGDLRDAAPQAGPGSRVEPSAPPGKGWRLNSPQGTTYEVPDLVG